MGPKKVVRGKFRVTENKNFNPKEAVPFALSVLIGAIAGWYILPKVWGDNFTEKYIYSNDKKIEKELFNITGAGIGAGVGAQLYMMIRTGIHYYSLQRNMRDCTKPITDAPVTVPVKSHLALQAKTLAPKSLGNMAKYATMILGSSVMYRFMKSVTDPLMSPSEAFAFTILIFAVTMGYIVGVEWPKDYRAMQASWITPQRIDLDQTPENQEPDSESAVNGLKIDL